MRVGDLHELQETLDRAVLPEAPVQRVEGDVGPHRLDDAGDVVFHVDRRHLIAHRLESGHAGPAGIQRHLALGRPPAHQDGYVLGHP